MSKTAFALDKREWHPGFIPGAIVLIGTYDSAGNPNVAPKSWLQMVSFDPPILMFSGTKDGVTERNILDAGCFTVNFVQSAMALKVFRCIDKRGLERIEMLGITLAPGQEVSAPLVRECPAHLECRLVDTKPLGSGFVVFGELAHASAREELLSGDFLGRYRRLDQIVFLEDGVYATLEPKKLSEV